MPPPGIPLDTTFLRGMGEGGTGYADRMSADREMMGQILTFCAFIGGIALAAVIELKFNSSVSNSLDRAMMPVLQMMLATCSAVALLGAFFAMLGIVNHHRMLDRQARLERIPKDAPERQWWQRDLFGKYANIAVFRQMARLFASVAMAVALVVVIMIGYQVDSKVGMVLTFGSLIMLIVPAILAMAARNNLIRAFESTLAKPAAPATPATPDAPKSKDAT